MEPEVCQSIRKLIGKLSTSGDKTVNAKGIKDLIFYAGKSEAYLKFTHESLLKQLRKKHAQIRLGTFLIINEFFKKSAFYRELLLDEFRTVLELTIGDEKQSLPPPPDDAEELKKFCFSALRSWNEKFGKSHHRIPIALNYVKSVLRVDVRNADPVEEQLHAEQNISGGCPSTSHGREKVLSEGAELESDVREFLTEMRSCFNLVVCRPEEFLGETSDNGTTSRGDEDVDLREHGLSAQTIITIEFNPSKAASIEIDEDNEVVIENLKGLYRRGKNRLLPATKQWIRAASKYGSSDQMTKVLELKMTLEAEISRYEMLDIEDVCKLSESTLQAGSSSDEDDDSDLEEVPEKEGYEDVAVAPPVIPATLNQCIGSRDANRDQVPGTSKASTHLRMGIPQSVNEVNDPTYGLKKEQLEKIVSEEKKIERARTRTSEMSDRKSKLLAVAPKLPFDVDLYHWEDSDVKTQKIVIADNGLHRFWQPLDREGEEVENPSGAAAIRTRTIEFTGQFEPVRWECRAPLPSGKLCPRRDRIRCPFHGKIVGRDEEGNPTNPDDIARLAKEKEEEDKNKVPEWQDPKLLRELKEKIGIDLTIRPAKRGGKTFAERYPKLADISKSKETPRSRLEKKIFSKRAVKRVAEVMDNMSKKRGRDKFGDQFNYTVD